MSSAGEHAASLQRAREAMAEVAVSVEDAAKLAGPPPGLAGPDADAHEVQQDADREQDDKRIIAGHLAVPRPELGHLRRGMPRTVRTRRGGCRTTLAT